MSNKVPQQFYIDCLTALSAIENCEDPKMSIAWHIQWALMERLTDCGIGYGNDQYLPSEVVNKLHEYQEMTDDIVGSMPDPIWADTMMHNSDWEDYDGVLDWFRSFLTEVERRK